MRHIGAVVSLLLCSVTAHEYRPFDRSQLSLESIFEQFDYPSLAESPWKVSRAKSMTKGGMKLFSIKGNGRLSSRASIQDLKMIWDWL